jgi:hypothetical protein
MSTQKSFQNKSAVANVAKNGGVGLPPDDFYGHNNLQIQHGLPPNNLQAHNDSYIFTFGTDLSTVKSLTEVHNAPPILDATTSATNNCHTNTQTLDITNSTFKTTVGLNDKGVTAVLDVVQTSSDDHFSSTHIYNDQDGSGQYTENFDIQVATGSTSTDLIQQTFTFNADGTITAAPVVPAATTSHVDHHNGLTPPSGATPPGQNVVLNKVTLDDVAYVTETVADISGTGYHFDVFRDDNNDGTWTQIAQGETLSGSVDATTHAIDLVGIQSYLASASAIVG